MCRKKVKREAEIMRKEQEVCTFKPQLMTMRSSSALVRKSNGNQSDQSMMQGRARTRSRSPHLASRKSGKENQQPDQFNLKHQNLNRQEREQRQRDFINRNQ